MTPDTQAAFQAEFHALLTRYGYHSGEALLLGRIETTQLGLPMQEMLVECVESHPDSSGHDMALHRTAVQGLIAGVQVAFQEQQRAGLQCDCPRCRSRN